MALMVTSVSRPPVSIHPLNPKPPNGVGSPARPTPNRTHAVTGAGCSHARRRVGNPHGRGGASEDEYHAHGPSSVAIEPPRTGCVDRPTLRLKHLWEWSCTPLRMIRRGSWAAGGDLSVWRRR